MGVTPSSQAICQGHPSAVQKQHSEKRGWIQRIPCFGMHVGSQLTAHGPQLAQRGEHKRYIIAGNLPCQCPMIGTWRKQFLFLSQLFCCLCCQVASYMSDLLVSSFHRNACTAEKKNLSTASKTYIFIYTFLHSVFS